MSYVYISHAADDLDTLLQVHESLRQVGIPAKYFTDAKEAHKRSAIDTLIDDASLVIVLVSASTMRSNANRADIERARETGIPVLPLRVDRARLSGYMRKAVGADLNISLLDPSGPDRLCEAALAQYRRRCPIIAIMNLKGGVGKTTIASQVTAAMQARTGNQTLLVDLDPQYNLTQLFFPMADADESAAVDRSAISLFEHSQLHQPGSVSPADNWRAVTTRPLPPISRDKLVRRLFNDGGPAGRLDLISGQFELSKYAFVHDADGLSAVRDNFLRSMDHYRSQYDTIVLDTNPNATFLTQCALEAADLVLAPMHTDIYSLRGIRLLNRVIEDHVVTHKQPDLRVIFNAVSRSEQTDFEADTRNGVYNDLTGFTLSEKILRQPLPKSSHLRVKLELDTPPWQRLAMHHGRGGGLKIIRENLTEIAMELETVLATAP